MSAYKRRGDPVQGVVVYQGETSEQAFRRAELERARWTWIEARLELEALLRATPWWEDFTPEGRT